MITVIIFSKDRAFQLDALLRSMIKHMSPLDQLSVYTLFTFSNENLRKGYVHVFQKSYHKQFGQFQWCMQRNFRTDLIGILSQVQTDLLFFLVDDIIVTTPIDFTNFHAFEYFNNHPQEVLTCSMRMGKNITKEPYPDFIEETDFLLWQWPPSGRLWHYPMSVDAHIFRCSDMIPYIQQLQFRAPNTLEGAMVRSIQTFEHKPRVCSPMHSVLFNNPLNRVQTENQNWHGNVSEHDLNDKFLAGECMDIDFFQNFENSSTHQIVEVPIQTQK
jgi:hypothetical protein